MTFAYSLAEQSRESGAFAGLIRARPGASPASVAAAVAAVGHSLDERYFNRRGLQAAIRSGLEAGSRRARCGPRCSCSGCPACFSCSCSRSISRRCCCRARRIASASSRSRARSARAPPALVRATLFEAGLLGAIGGVGATFVAAWGTRVLVALAPVDLPRRESIAVDWRVAFAIIAIGALLGLRGRRAPAFWATRATLATLLRNAAVRGGGGHGRCVARSSSCRSRWDSCC